MCGRTGIILLAISAAILPLGASPASAASPDAAGATAGATAGAAVKARFDLPAESLDKALRDFALQAQCNISYEPSLVAGLRAPTINGEFTIDRVLSILLKGTRLRAVNINEDTIQILEKPPAAPHGTDPPIPAAQPSDPRETSSPGADAAGRSRDLDEITVTGTHIRGTKDSPSPVQVFTRADIDATGMLTVQQFLQTLPQNFGGASENTISSIAARGRTNNTVNGSAPNLRGLGAEATLVLINGHRVAPGNTDGSFIDISMIPLAAIERIEIVTDGASAIYGSDAVGGVVNIILRSQFDGSESRALFGAVSEGSMHTVQAAQTVGDAWANGSALMSYQYSDQTPLSAGSREYLHSVLLPFSLLPEQVQHAVFANIDEEITSGFALHGDAMYSHRSTQSVFSDNEGVFGDDFTAIPSRVDSYAASAGFTVALPRQSKFAMVGTYSESDTSQQYFARPAAEPMVYAIKAKSGLASLDANLDGVLTTLPSGAVHYAVGAQYRRESFGATYLFPPTDNTFYPRRNVEGGYAEVRIPVLGPNSGSHEDPALELTAADRAEHYSDFGATNNPQVGMIWKPLSGVAVRGTYGTSFKAPLLSELNPVPDEVIPFPGAIFNPAPGGTPNTLIVDGGNPGLKPEKATVWTVGLDFKPAEIAGLAARFTYYNIVFKDEIIAAESSISVLDAFVDEAILGPEIVQRNPSSSLVHQLISAPSYENPFNVDPMTIGAVLDDRNLNLSIVKTTGLDFRIDYKTKLFGSGIDAGIDGTYIFAFDNQFSSTAPVASFLNTPYNPVDLRLRGRTIIARGPLSTAFFLNFTNAYRDTNTVPNGHVASWSTADALVSYGFEAATGPTSGLSIALSVTNLTNRAPPYVAGYTNYGINYDGVNANTLGRFISLRLQKRW
jgi:outer membrane receptor protein involved in Fe transport